MSTLNEKLEFNHNAFEKAFDGIMINYRGTRPIPEPLIVFFYLGILISFNHWPKKEGQEILQKFTKKFDRKMLSEVLNKFWQVYSLGQRSHSLL
jgi:hypothetical protein